MLYANTPDNLKIIASPKALGFCPFCKSKMIPRCGATNIPHWAHESLLTCDSWYHQETEWHLSWKARFPQKNTEVILKKNGETHIADYYNPLSNMTIEFQNSNLSLDERIARELFYPNLVWIINVKNKSGLKLEWEEGIGYHTKKYRWKNAIKWVTEYPNNSCYYMLDEFPEKNNLFQIIQFNHEKGYDINDFGWKKYHHTYITGIVWEKEYFVFHTNNNLAWW